MRWIRLLFRAFGWLLTPLLAWAASFFGAVGGALVALRMHDPIRGVIVTAACGGLAGFLAILGWLRYLRRSPEVREALAVTEDGTPDTTEFQITVLVVLGTFALAPAAKAQTVSGNIGHVFEDGGWASYRAGVLVAESRLFGVHLHGDFFKRTTGADGQLAGLGMDVTVLRSPAGGPYGVLGIGGGFGSETGDDYSDAWGTWSAGAGYEIFPLSFLSMAGEGRWRDISLGKRHGLELAIGLGLHLGGRRTPPAPPPLGSVDSSAASLPGPTAAPGPASAPSLATAATLADSVIATATAAMGRPYKLGGVGTDSSGFDCSGLIQYAFGAHGLTLPRRSADQARQGRAVAKQLDLLRPGDLLTFSNRRKAVTHVGLYLGDGRFVHSATRGVQVSVLSADDPYGRWWYKRWVGVRRIID